MAAQLAVPLEPSVVAGVSRKRSEECKAKIRKKMRERWADTRYRAMVALSRLEAAGNGSKYWLPPMTDKQRKYYRKLRMNGYTREEALKEITKNEFAR